MYNRKECKPEETVKKIKKILKKFEINVVEKEIININNSFYSTRVELKEIKESIITKRKAGYEENMLKLLNEYVEKIYNQKA